MKRVGNLYEKIYNIENLRKAYQNAKRGKRWYKEVIEIEKDPDKYLYILQNMLKNHTYKTSNYGLFYKKDGKKMRKIYKLPFFPDRIAQWAILQIIEPYIINHLINDTYSAIPNRGIHYGLKRVQKAMQTDIKGCQYCLKIDIQHYYQSINHKILKTKFRKLFKDKELLWILDEITDSISTADKDDLISIYSSNENIDFNTGIPIGNYLSQYSGNYYLSDFDHWIKETKHIKHYFRYMDDIVIFEETKEELHKLLIDINAYFITNLKLKIKNNWQVFPTYIRGVDYLGYRIFMKFILLRKTTCIRMKKKVKSIQRKIDNGELMNYSEWCSINSYKGWLKPANSFRLEQKYLHPLALHITTYYETIIKKRCQNDERLRINQKHY